MNACKGWFIILRVVCTLGRKLARAGELWSIYTHTQRAKYRERRIKKGMERERERRVGVKKKRKRKRRAIYLLSCRGADTPHRQGLPSIFIRYHKSKERLLTLHVLPPSMTTTWLENLFPFNEMTGKVIDHPAAADRFFFSLCCPGPHVASLLYKLHISPAPATKLPLGLSTINQQPRALPIHLRTIVIIIYISTIFFFFYSAPSWGVFSVSKSMSVHCCYCP